MNFQHVMGITGEDCPYVMALVPDPEITVERRRTSVSTFHSLKEWSSAFHIGRFRYGTKPAVASLGKPRCWPRPEISLCDPNVQLAVVAPSVYGVSVLRGMHSRYFENTDRTPIRSIVRLDKSFIKFVPLDLRMHR